jgi:hypothetical protein
VCSFATPAKYASWKKCFQSFVKRVPCQEHHVKEQHAYRCSGKISDRFKAVHKDNARTCFDLI